MDVYEAIKTRRSIRKFQNIPVERDKIDKILEAGIWAPSGLNNQPWRFVIVENKEMISEIAEHTKYKRIILSAQVLIIVFLDTSICYDRIKDLQAIGACIQNMLLNCHALGLGSCWIGEILNQREKVEQILQVPDTYELMAALAIGYPDQKGKSSRKSLNELIFKMT